MTIDNVVNLWQLYIDAIIDGLVRPYVAADEVMIELAEVTAMLRYFEMSDVVQFPNEAAVIAQREMRAAKEKRREAKRERMAKEKEDEEALD